MGSETRVDDVETERVGGLLEDMNDRACIALPRQPAAG
jgi:hypothetical protein